ncbi:MAG: ABC transporter ATP-binding protein [Gemmatimonadaceae bacterium]
MSRPPTNRPPTSGHSGAHDGARVAAAGGVPPALEMAHVARRFGSTVALRDASLVVPPGTLHALLGENGAGKSTLLHVAFGHLRPDSGTIAVNGRPRHFASPADAIAAGVGMVHQHFRLVPAMTVAENVALGRPGRWLALARVSEDIERLGEESGLRVDPRARVETLGVAGQQRVEIVKALLRDARVLILDEPTAVLAPSEAEELLAWVRRYVDAGNAAVLITHKLREALAIADTVTVLRRGETVLTAPAGGMSETTVIDAMIDAMIGVTALSAAAAAAVGASAGTGTAGTASAGGEMVAGEGPTVARGGHSVARGAPPNTEIGSAITTDHHRFPAAAIERPPSDPPGAPSTSPSPPVLRLRDAAYRDALGVTRLHAATVDIRAGEIVGMAGVEGAGQHELLRILAGRLSPTSGEATLPARIGFVPEDRHRDALALTRPLVENVVLRGAGRRRGRIRWNAESTLTAALLEANDVRGGTPRTLAAALSGGNQQKLVMARELADDPPALVVESPTRGLDVRAGAAVLDRLRAARERGMAVVVYSSDLDELLLLADRVIVAHAGQLREVPLDHGAIGRALVGAR